MARLDGFSIFGGIVFVVTSEWEEEERRSRLMIDCI
jgi:hypothetical protein